MPTYRISYLMALAGNSWRYSGYRVATGARLAVQQAQQALGANNLNLLDALLEVHPPSTACVRVSAARVSEGDNLPVPREAFSQRINRPGTATALLPDVTNTSIKLLLDSDQIPSAQRTLDLSGLPDEWTRRLAASGGTNLTATVMGKLRTIVQAVSDAVWLLRRKKDPLPDTAERWRDVTSLAAEANSAGVNTVVTMREAHTWTAGMRIAFNRQDACEVSGLTGEHVIRAVPTPESFIINVRYRSTLAILFPSGMRARKIAYDYQAVRRPGVNEEISFTLGTRQRGARVDSGRGRRRAKSCRH